jgi:hypothetical protein
MSLVLNRVSDSGVPALFRLPEYVPVSDVISTAMAPSGLVEARRIANTGA